MFLISGIGEGDLVHPPQQQLGHPGGGSGVFLFGAPPQGRCPPAPGQAEKKTEPGGSE